MPAASRWFIKTAFGCLVAALALAAGLPLFPASEGAVRPAVVHLLVVGWLTQLIFGVAYWLFPRHSRTHPHGPHTGRVWAAYVLLNAGLLLRLIAEPGLTLWGWDGRLLVLAGAAQTLGVLAYTTAIWPRIKTK